MGHTRDVSRLRPFTVILGLGSGQLDFERTWILALAAHLYNWAIKNLTINGQVLT